MKKQELSAINARQIELLSKYYPLDKENNVFSVQLYYQKVSDILYNDISDFDHPRVNDDQLSRIGDILDKIPNGYTVDLSFSFDDYEGYKPEAVLDGINDAIELNHYKRIKDSKTKWFLASMLIVVGLIILTLLSVLSANGIFGDATSSKIFEEVMDISAWVFIWEAVTILFLSPSEYVRLGLSFARKVNKVSMYKEGNKEVLISESKEELFANWADDKKHRKFGRYCLLFSGAALLADSLSLALVDGVGAWNNTYSDLTANETIIANSISFVTVIILSAIILLTALVAINRYHESNRLQKFSIPCFILMAIVLIVRIYYIIINFSNIGVHGIFATTISLFSAAGFVVGFILTSPKLGKK